jgi:hypothetical protein
MMSRLWGGQRIGSKQGDNLKEAIRIFNQLKSEGVIADYAIGGGAATLFYTEPFFTEDVDMFVHLTTQSVLISLTPIYERIADLGGIVDGLYIKIGDANVQIIVPPGDLEIEAIEHAQTLSYDSIPVRVFRPEYLIVIYLRVNRPKDKLKAELLAKQAPLDHTLLSNLLKRFTLIEAWKTLQEKNS